MSIFFTHTEETKKHGINGIDSNLGESVVGRELLLSSSNDTGLVFDDSLLDGHDLLGGQLHGNLTLLLLYKHEN